ncbi:MAG TPA: helix-turn-helix domain-containing protein [Thermodesulfobacteriota bacterium]
MSAREPTYYDLLEVAPTATREEIQVAYNKSRAAFAANSLAVYSLFSADECREMQQRIEEAYRTLMNEEARARYDESIGIPPARPQGRPVSTLLKPPAPPAVPVRPVARPSTPPEAPARSEAGRAPGAGRAGAGAAERPTLPEGAVVTGALLRKIREQQGISLRDIAQTTKVNLTYLQFIEEENFRQLPVPAYLRGFLKAYAKCIGLDPERVSAEYVKLYALYHEIKAER